MTVLGRLRTVPMSPTSQAPPASKAAATLQTTASSRCDIRVADGRDGRTRREVAAAEAWMTQPCRTLALASSADSR